MPFRAAAPGPVGRRRTGRGNVPPRQWRPWQEGAWNRLVEVWEDADSGKTLDDPGDTLMATYRYDALGRRLRKTVEEDPP